MAVGNQRVRIRRSSDHVEVWNGIAPRDTDDYPLTTQGQLDYQAAVSAGNHGGITTSEGGIVPAGTPPTLIKPSPPVESYPAYSKKLQAEDGTSNIAYSGSPGDGTSRAFGSNSGHYIEWNITDAPTADGNYTFGLRYQTTSGSVASTIKLILNDGTPISVTLPPTGGSINPLTITGKTLQKNNNKIRIEGDSGNFGIDYLTITHPASA